MAKSGRVSGETDFIQKYLAPLAKSLSGAFSLRDDAACLDIGAGFELVVTVDAVAAGVHFFPDDGAADIAWKALAVNVSDLAAKGAQPIAYLMSLAFPKLPDAEWMVEFTRGLAAAQSAFAITLAGGDTDRRDGPLAITITALGRVPKGEMVKRSGGHQGDHLFLSGTIGDAGLGLALRNDETLQDAWQLDGRVRDYLLNRYLRPRPRNKLAAVLLHHASAAIDISDGLAKDTTALAAASGTGARVVCAQLPLSDAARLVRVVDGAALTRLVTDGGDYEVLAAVPPDNRTSFINESHAAGVAVTEIGSLTAGKEVVFEDIDGTSLSLSVLGYDHFA